MPVEVANCVWAVRDAHSHSNTPGIDLSHNAFGIFIGRFHRADPGAGRMVTLHARDGIEMHCYVGVGTFYL